MYAQDVLFNDMGVADFLSERQCIAGIHPFTHSNGIENGKGFFGYSV